MASIRDIAELSGFSVSTVSRVLNNHPYVSTEKREIIKKIITELDYSVNQNAVNLSLGKTKVIGVIVPYISNPSFNKMIKGIFTAAMEHKYNLMLLPTNYQKTEELKHLHLLKNKQVDGLIITSKANEWHVLQQFTKYGPIVMCEKTPFPEFSAAYTERLSCYTEVFNYLKAAGHQQVAFTVPRPKSKSNSAKWLMEAYKNVFQSPQTSNYLENCTTYEDGLRAGAYFLKQKTPPTAIYANGDEVAAGIYYYAKKQGYNLPTELLLIGEESLSIGKVLNLPSMDRQIELLGATAFNLALQPNGQKMEIPFILRFPSQGN